MTRYIIADVNKYHDINITAVAIAAIGFIVASSWVTYMSELAASVFWGKDRDNGDTYKYLWASLTVTGIILLLIILAIIFNNRKNIFDKVEYPEYPEYPE